MTPSVKENKESAQWFARIQQSRVAVGQIPSDPAASAEDQRRFPGAGHRAVETIEVLLKAL
jgi:hypothetical protein